MHTVVAETRITVIRSTDPTLTTIGWAAARQGDRFLIVVSAALAPWQQSVACLEAVTDREYLAYVNTLPLAEQARRTLLGDARPRLTAREAMIAHRTLLGEAGVWDAEVASLPLCERSRRAALDGSWACEVPAFVA